MEKVLYCFYKIILKRTRKSETSQPFTYSLLNTPVDPAMRARVVAQLFYKMLTPGQTIATVQRNISQHCWPSICTKPRPNDRNMPTQHVATLLAQYLHEAPAKLSQHANTTCCNIVGRNMLGAFGHRVATCCNMLGVVGSNFKMVKFEPTTPNILQHIATRWPNARNMLRLTMLRYVALKCCDRLAGALCMQHGIYFLDCMTSIETRPTFRLSKCLCQLISLDT